MMPTPVDLLIEARWIIPVEPDDTTLEHHAIAVERGKIVAILPLADARARYMAAKTVSLPEHVQQAEADFHRLNTGPLPVAALVTGGFGSACTVLADFH